MTEQKFPTSQVPDGQNPIKPQTREEATVPDRGLAPLPTPADPAPETQRKRGPLSSEEHLGFREKMKP
jgi:hypothetical protein